MIQRLTRMGVNRAEAQLSVGEQVAKVMMRRRARMSISCHMVLCLTCSPLCRGSRSARNQDRSSQRSISCYRPRRELCESSSCYHKQADLQWRRELHKFESYASQLATHTEHLRAKVDKEKIDTERLHEGVYIRSLVEDRLTSSRCRG
jgi:hypothetical protein